MAAQYNHLMTTILDEMVSLKKTTYRVRQSDPWYDDECRSAKRSARKLERRYKRTAKTSKQSPSVCLHQRNRLEKHAWLQALKASHRLVEQRRRRFWRTQADNSTNPSRLWQTIDSVLGRGKENNSTSLTPEYFSAFFTSKVEDVRRRTHCAPPPQYMAYISRDCILPRNSLCDNLTSYNLAMTECNKQRVDRVQRAKATELVRAWIIVVVVVVYFWRIKDVGLCRPI